MKRRKQGGIYKDKEYSDEKKKVRRILKKYRRTRKEETRRELIAARSKLKKVYKIKTEEWKESRWKRLEGSRNLPEF